MARCCSVLLLLGFVVMTGAAAAVPGGGDGCEVSTLAADVAASCASGAATPPCCEPVLASVELGGGACLCRLASELPVLQAGLNGSALAALYARCGDGGAAASLAACHGPPPEVIKVIIKLVSDDRKLLREFIVSQMIPSFLVLIIAAVKVCRRIFRHRKL